MHCFAAPSSARLFRCSKPFKRLFRGLYNVFYTITGRHGLRRRHRTLSALTPPPQRFIAYNAIIIFSVRHNIVEHDRRRGALTFSIPQGRRRVPAAGHRQASDTVRA